MDSWISSTSGTFFFNIIHIRGIVTSKPERLMDCVDTDDSGSASTNSLNCLCLIEFGFPQCSYIDGLQGACAWTLTFHHGTLINNTLLYSFYLGITLTFDDCNPLGSQGRQ